MNQAQIDVFKMFRWLALAYACLAAGTAHADAYADVHQLVRANKPIEALTQIEAYLVGKPADPQMRFLKGVIQRQIGQQTQALSTFTRLTEDYPELPEPYNNLAVIYASQGQYDKARAALEMAIRTNPSYATAHENLGDIYARLASQAYNKALQLDDGNAAVPPKLALIGDVFKPNLGNARPAVPATAAVVSAPVVPAMAVASAKPAPTTTSPPPSLAPSPAPLVKPSAAVSAPAEKVPALPALASDAKKEVETAILSWAKAWSDKNTTAYLKAYSPQFKPAGKQARSTWEKERRDRINGKNSISVKLSNLQVIVKGDQATASFRQAYKADALSVSSRKTLELHKHANQWLISRESNAN
jgi:tetratricopeptide (TPR) repeat protein